MLVPRHTHTHTHLYLSICLCVYLPISRSIYLPTYLHTSSICLSMSIPTYLSICPAVCLSVCLPVYLHIHLSIYLSVCLPYLCMYLFLSWRCQLGDIVEQVQQILSRNCRVAGRQEPRVFGFGAYRLGFRTAMLWRGRLDNRRRTHYSAHHGRPGEVPEGTCQPAVAQSTLAFSSWGLCKHPAPAR